MQAKQDNKQDWHQRILSELLGAPSVNTRVGPALTSVGHLIKFDLTNSFPATTAKKLFFGQVKRELHCFLKGQTSEVDLHAAGVKIWDADLKRTGRSDIGPIYGWQWRNWNGNRLIPHMKGFDQLRWAIDELKATNGNTRRALISAWNVTDVLSPAAVLPPCHVLFQFNMVGETLYTDVYQRSADAFLGLPFDVASFAIMSRLVKNEVQLHGDTILRNEVLNYHIANLHLYEEHKEAAQQELNNEPSGEKPELHCFLNVDNFHYDLCHLAGYNESRVITAKLLT